MNNVNQNKALASMQKVLVPSSNLIDGRSERDRLCFLVDFASLINFYNNDNKVDGNWSPFLLKDPVFLLAYISNTRFAEIHNDYKNICHKLEQLLIYKTVKKDLSISMNRLFEQLTHLCMRLERWTHHMHKSTEQYELKDYVINEITTKFSAIFWAVLSLRENLVLTKAIEGIRPVKFYLFELYDDIIWKQSRDKTPFWELLNVKQPFIKEQEVGNYQYINALNCYNALKVAGDDLFNFFYTSIQFSANEYEKVKLNSSRYPDTTLLRTFINLLGVQQEQLNGIAKKHLHFYYKDILKQTKLPATADSVIICADLAKTTATLTLPAGTLFNAGLDAQKKPILFASQRTVELNPAVISNIYTLAQITSAGKLNYLCLQNIKDVDKVIKDVSGNVVGWETFGGEISDKSIAPKLGFAFASPLLLLREGCRKIQLHLSYDISLGGKVDLETLNKASYYLSTQSGWLKLSLTTQVIIGCPENTSLNDVVIENNTFASNPLLIEINLDETQPAIESFLINPDGIASNWPMFKIEFSEISQLDAPPVFVSLSIEVTVSNLKTFQLYNSTGALSTKTPYPLLGQSPAVNSSFIIGSTEIFSKPITSLSIELDWDKLPDNFSDYYSQYNAYIKKYKTDNVVEKQEEKQEENKIENELTGFQVFLQKASIQPLKKLAGKITSFFKKAKYKTISKNTSIPVFFDNNCFVVDFKILQNQVWIDLEMKKRTIIASNIDKELLKSDAPLLPQILFNSPLNTPNIFSKSIFDSVNSGNTLTGFPCNPEIQNTALKYIDNSACGFMKMELIGPSYGFGTEIYPNVLSYVALTNAYNISHSQDKDFKPLNLDGTEVKDNTPITIYQPPNLPFTPKLTNFCATYTASYTYDLKKDEEVYPLQCFLYSAFSNYLVYDNSKKRKDYQDSYLTSIVDTKKVVSGVPLFSSLNAKGALFIEMDNLLPAESINLYFELSRSYGDVDINKQIRYYYLSTDGWKKMTVLADETNQFSCSGILSLIVPMEVTKTSTVMGTQKFWLSIAVENSPLYFANTLFLKPNGIKVQRNGSSFLTNYQAPILPANSIVKPQNSIPALTLIMQPFNSSGGKGAENTVRMNERVSNRIKTKDRVVSAEDYYRIIKQEFSDIYFSKTLLNQQTKIVEVLIVKNFQDPLEPGAFMPMISECKEEKIRIFLNDRTSAFCSINVSNFKFQNVKISTEIVLKSNYDKETVYKNINESLTIYLSPWIKSENKQVIIDEEITASQVAAFILSIDGVAEVQCVGFSTWMVGKPAPKDVSTCKDAQLPQTVKPLDTKSLLVSDMQHNIICSFNP